MNQAIIAIDVQNMLWRNWYALKNYNFGNPAIHGLLRDLRYIAKMTMSTDFVFCFDSERSIRKEVFPDYKGNREETADRKSVRQQTKLLYEKILPELGYLNLLKIDGTEADDVMGLISKDPIYNKQIRLVSNDSDLYQLLDKQRVEIWNPISKFMLDEDYLWTQYDVHPCEWVRLKSLTGCETDNIPGIPGIGMARATSYIRGRILNTSKIHTTIQEHQELIMRNSELVMLPCWHLLECKLPDLQSQHRVEETIWNKVVERYGMQNLCGRQPV